MTPSTCEAAAAILYDCDSAHFWNSAPSDLNKRSLRCHVANSGLFFVFELSLDFCETLHGNRIGGWQEGRRSFRRAASGRKQQRSGAGDIGEASHGFLQRTGRQGIVFAETAGGDSAQ